jgi:hypothetical protein
MAEIQFKPYMQSEPKTTNPMYSINLFWACKNYIKFA